MAARIVVGVDGSEPSIRALQWALREAALRGAVIDVVTAWTFPDRPAPLDIVIDVPFQEELLVKARAKLNEIVDEVVPASDRARVHTDVIRGGAVTVLLEAARGADLLVVGHHGRGAIAELLGSVSERCVRRGECPVVVVR
jgi:nucleotide-binding universal stress UspA family protein